MTLDGSDRETGIRRARAFPCRWNRFRRGDCGTVTLEDEPAVQEWPAPVRPPSRTVGRTARRGFIAFTVRGLWSVRSWWFRADRWLMADGVTSAVAIASAGRSMHHARAPRSLQTRAVGQ